MAWVSEIVCWAVKAVVLYVFVVRCIISTTARHFLYPGPPLPSWALPFHVVMELLRDLTTSFEVGTPIGQLRKLNDSSYNMPPSGVRVLAKEVPGRFRERAHQMVRARMQHDMGFALPPVRDTHWSNAPSLTIELALPEGKEIATMHKAVFMAHGGAYMFCSVNSYRPMACRVAQLMGEVTTSKFDPASPDR